MTDPNINFSEFQGFDYCFWSKLLVAIVLFPLVAAISILLFSSIVLKITMGAFAIGGIVYTAAKIDEMPCFAGKIPAVIKKRR